MSTKKQHMAANVMPPSGGESTGPHGAPLPQALREKVLLSVTEAATLLSLSEVTIHRMIADGRLQSRKIARRRLVVARSVAQIAGLLEDQAA